MKFTKDTPLAVLGQIDTSRLSEAEEANLRREIEEAAKHAAADARAAEADALRRAKNLTKNR